MGDNIRVVGDQERRGCSSSWCTATPQRAEETNMLPFLVGLLLGILLGAIPINLPNGMQSSWAAPAGRFIVSLLVGHFGGLGPLRAVCARRRQEPAAASWG